MHFFFSKINYSRHATVYVVWLVIPPSLVCVIFVYFRNNNISSVVVGKFIKYLTSIMYVTAIFKIIYFQDRIGERSDIKPPEVFVLLPTCQLDTHQSYSSCSSYKCCSHFYVFTYFFCLPYIFLL